jgi:uncharacterized membrane protein
MQTTPEWALTLSYWLHMVATVVWIGGIAASVLLVQPLVIRNVSPERAIQVMRQLRKRLQNLGWFSFAVFTVTGLIQMSASPRYEGLLVVYNRWSVAIFAKHIVFGLLLLVCAYLTWFLNPALERAIILQAKGGKGSETITRLQKHEIRLTWLNLGLSLVVLILTALARIS